MLLFLHQTLCKTSISRLHYTVCIHIYFIFINLFICILIYKLINVCNFIRNQILHGLTIFCGLFQSILFVHSALCCWVALHLCFQVLWAGVNCIAVQNTTLYANVYSNSKHIQSCAHNPSDSDSFPKTSFARYGRQSGF